MTDSYASVSSPWLVDTATITALFGKQAGRRSRDYTTIGSILAHAASGTEQ